MFLQVFAQRLCFPAVLIAICFANVIRGCRNLSREGEEKKKKGKNPHTNNKDSSLTGAEFLFGVSLFYATLRLIFLNLHKHEPHKIIISVIT